MGLAFIYTLQLIISLNSADPFHVQTLRAYIKQFEFRNDPLDVALRKLLMEVGLPRETQQIDRVIEAFAARYLECNPSLFVSEGTFVFVPKGLF